jgi:pyruvate,orthophosphate dikinase
MPDVYFFADGKADGRADMKDVLGGKGANLAEMTNLGIPVPPGFTISARLCVAYLKEGKLPSSLRGDVAGSVMPRFRCSCPCDQGPSSPCPG